jgi:hypothetical protein
LVILFAMSEHLLTSVVPRNLFDQISICHKLVNWTAVFGQACALVSLDILSTVLSPSALEVCD